MTCVKIPGGRICFPDIFRIRTGAGEFLFEYHKFCGPQIVAPETFEPLPNPLNEDHPFWSALTAWIHNGMRVDVEGYCILEAPGATD